MSLGKIQRLRTEIGIGFIREVGIAEDILFHSAALLEGTFDRLSEGQEVEFDHKPFPNAPGKSRAVNIRLVTQAN